VQFDEEFYFMTLFSLILYRFLSESSLF